jgi:hypothetical protein
MTLIKNKVVIQSDKNNLLISTKGTNISGSYRECEERDCTRLISCPHVRCQEYRKDMAIQDWTVQYIEP